MGLAVAELCIKCRANVGLRAQAMSRGYYSRSSFSFPESGHCRSLMRGGGLVRWVTRDALRECSGPRASGRAPRVFAERMRKRRGRFLRLRKGHASLSGGHGRDEGRRGEGRRRVCICARWGRAGSGGTEGRVTAAAAGQKQEGTSNPLYFKDRVIEQSDCFVGRGACDPFLICFPTPRSFWFRKMTHI